MGIYFRKRKNIAPGVNFNVSNKSAGVSLGVKGLHVSTNTNGTKSMSASIPGTGLYARKTFGQNKSSSAANNNQVNFSSDNIGNGGGNNKKPWYKKTWVIVLLSILGFGFIVGALGDDDNSNNDITNFTTLQAENISSIIDDNTTIADNVPVSTEADTTLPVAPDTTPVPETTPTPTTTPAPTTTLAPTTTPAPTTAPTTTPAPTTTIQQTVATTTAPVPQQNLVWISKTGKKYHRNSSCSNMKNPSQVTLDKAQSLGLEPCKKCY